MRGCYSTRWVDEKASGHQDGMLSPSWLWIQCDHVLQTASVVSPPWCWTLKLWGKNKPAPPPLVFTTCLYQSSRTSHYWSATGECLLLGIHHTPWKVLEKRQEQRRNILPCCPSNMKNIIPDGRGGTHGSSHSHVIEWPGAERRWEASRSACH